MGRPQRSRRLRRRRVPRLHAHGLSSGSGSAGDLDHLSPAAARLRDGLPAPRAHADRAPGRRDDRRPGQRGHHRGSRRRGRADPARDAAHPGARVHAHRARRRRPAEEEPAAARRPRPGHDGGAQVPASRSSPGRAPDRDSLCIGRGARACRRGRADRARSREDAAGSRGDDLDRLQLDRADPPRRGGGPARARAGGGRHRVDRRLPHRRGRPRHRSGRLDRIGALPPDRAGRADEARARRQRLDCSISNASSWTSGDSTRRRRCSRTPGTSER